MPRPNVQYYILGLSYLEVQQVESRKVSLELINSPSRSTSGASKVLQPHGFNWPSYSFRQETTPKLCNIMESSRVSSGRVGRFRPITEDHFHKYSANKTPDWPKIAYAIRWHTWLISRYNNDMIYTHFFKLKFSRVSGVTKASGCTIQII